MPESVDDKKATFDEFTDSYTRTMERRIRTLETEKQLLEVQRNKLEEDRDNLRLELQKLKQPPLFTGTLLEVLENGKAIVKSSTGPSFVVVIDSTIPKDILVPNSRVALHQRNFAILEILPQSTDPLVRSMEIDIKPSETYEDIGGLRDQLLDLRETVELPLLQPELFEKVGIEPPKGVLLHGPPGSGKTLMVKAVAHETQATFIRVIGSELVQKYIGEGARLVREVFAYARDNSPSILFIDELDAIGSKRLDIATSGDREVQRTLMQLLSELDGFSPRGDVKIIGATNRVDILDPALMRPGRFDRHIEVPLPNLEERFEILKIHSRSMNIEKNVDLNLVATQMVEASGADIRAITQEAGMFAIRERVTIVKSKHFLSAIDKVISKKKETLSGKNEYT
ncbi:proteasome-activating nucleotidase [Candidatus Heimdallarchaeota archaeon B3_Heim]|nr:MAG: proteasome-activating nucleotidase [Candidatus Heimdallarchaeota archaeon B3_Heim]